ncbi:MAG: hypothetical protein WEB89_04380 [Balneolales bacterium]
MLIASSNFCISKVAPVFFIMLLAISCNQIPEKDWLKAIPEYVPAIVIPEQNANISTVMRSEYLPFFEDISTSSISTISQVENVPEISILLKGMAIFPTEAQDWKPLWIAETDKNLLSTIAPHFNKKYAENEYNFNGVKIHILHIDEENLYATQLHQWVLISESSYAIEEALRTYLNNDSPGIDMDASKIQSSSLVMNAPYFDRWLAQSGAPRYRPMIKDVFKGTKAGVFFINSDRGGPDNLSISGSLPLADNKTSLINSISHSNQGVVLDRYIPVDAAAFGIFNHSPEPYPPKNIATETSLDSLLLTDTDLYRDIAETLHPSFAYVAYGASGYLSVGENLYIRRLSDQAELNQIMQRLARDGFAERINNTYSVESRVFADLLGSSLNDYDYFSLSISHNGAVFSQRPGLTSRIESDRSRRRVMYYDDNYTMVRNEFPEKMSAFFYAKSSEYLEYLGPVLSPNNYTSIISSQFDVSALSLNLDNSGNNLDFNLKTFRTEESEQPYRERWVFPLDNTDLTGAPVLANLGGSNSNEILFATDNSRIYALATDGTTLFETDTGTDIPIGQPLIYDWYGNDQKAILIAAGNKIYAWNNRGGALPSFPVEMDEQITAPLQVADISRDGRAELIVATADRKINVLDGRGENISGWPQTTNSRIESQPVFKQIEDNWAIWAYAENGLFSWNTNGRLQSGYPVFIESSFRGEPFFYKDNVIAAAADGHLYSIGRTKIFTDSLSREARVETASLEEDENTDNVESIYVANSSLVNTPLIETLRINKEETDSFQEEMIITQSANGSIFVYNTKGQLRMTQSMGQPSDENHNIIIHDINSSGSPEIIALAGFGRLYAWNSLTGEPYKDLPTSAMTYPIVADIYGDGGTELIAKTREGLRAWTILP